MKFLGFFAGGLAVVSAFVASAPGDVSASVGSAGASKTAVKSRSQKFITTDLALFMPSLAALLSMETTGEVRMPLVGFVRGWTGSI